jgi:hypothetical protein
MQAPSRKILHGLGIIRNIVDTAVDNADQEWRQDEREPLEAARRWIAELLNPFPSFPVERQLEIRREVEQALGGYTPDDDY